MATEAMLQEEDYHARFDLAVWKKLLGYTRPYRARVAALAVVAVLLAACEAGFAVFTPFVVDDVITTGGANLGCYALAYLAVTVVFCANVMAFIRLAGGISTGMSHDIRRNGFDHLQDLSFSFYDRRPAGWLVARLTSDCDRVARIIAWGSLDVIWGISMIVGISAIMLAVDWKLALLVLGVLPPLIWISLAFQKRILAASRAIRKQNSNITASYAESIAGMRTTKTFVREERNFGEFAHATRKMYCDSVRNAVLSAAYFPIVMTLCGIGAGMVLWVGGGQAAAGTISAGTLILFVTCSGQFVFPTLEMARVFADLQSAQAAAERIFTLIDTEPEIRDTAAVLQAIEDCRIDGRRPGMSVDGMPQRIAEVTFRNVSFAYEEDHPVLNDFNLSVKAGQVVALTGPTGGGKSTIVSLLCRFYEPTCGGILIDGVDYRDRSLAWLQSNLGIVLQQPHVFIGTIRENIRYGRLDASDGQIERAARLVCAHDFIAALEDGYDTRIAEGGSNLSTGQKQLISFARAVLADPQIFVMDEATSSVDTETEQLIQRGLASVLRGRMSLVIAHRLSTIRSADIILVIDDGGIVEQGSHRELIGLQGRYYELYTNQFADEQTGEMLASDGG